jgi:hypothetical protein
MRSAREWVDEVSQSGAFDLVNDIHEAEELVRKIQEDARTLEEYINDL